MFLDLELFSETSKLRFKFSARLKRLSFWVFSRHISNFLLFNPLRQESRTFWPQVVGYLVQFRSKRWYLFYRIFHIRITSEHYTSNTTVEERLLSNITLSYTNYRYLEFSTIFEAFLRFLRQGKYFHFFRVNVYRLIADWYRLNWNFCRTRKLRSKWILYRRENFLQANWNFPVNFLLNKIIKDILRSLTKGVNNLM